MASQPFHGETGVCPGRQSETSPPAQTIRADALGDPAKLMPHRTTPEPNPLHRHSGFFQSRIVPDMVHISHCDLRKADGVKNENAAPLRAASQLLRSGHRFYAAQCPSSLAQRPSGRGYR